jgi:hypothetical protein
MRIALRWWIILPLTPRRDLVGRWPRKVRIAREGGGYRTIYVFGGVHMPIFLVTMFAKNEKDNLTKAEQAELMAMSKALLARYGGRK